MKIEINIKNPENITPLHPEDLLQINEIVNALIATGGLTRVKGGQTIIHFDHNGLFQRIELDYYPFVRRAK